MFESGHQGRLTALQIKSLFKFRWRHMADPFQESAVVEPVEPFEGGELDPFKMAPGAALANHPGLVQADDGLGQGIVVGIPDLAHRRLDPGLGQALGVADRQVESETRQPTIRRAWASTTKAT